MTIIKTPKCNEYDYYYAGNRNRTGPTSLNDMTVQAVSCTTPYHSLRFVSFRVIQFESSVSITRRLNSDVHDSSQRDGEGEKSFQPVIQCEVAELQQLV